MEEREAFNKSKKTPRSLRKGKEEKDKKRKGTIKGEKE